MRSNELDKVSIAALGGTIAMTPSPGEDGVAPTLTAEMLIEGVPELTSVARLFATTLSKLPGASLTGSTVADTVAWAAGEVDAGAAGVVIAQGTDTLEETAYLAQLYWDREEPLVFTGAMRSPNQPSADGPANLVAACRVAVSSQCRGGGVFVVLDNQIHAASTVRKEHSTALSSFASPAPGLAGELIEGRVYLYRKPLHDRRTPLPSTDPFVPLLETHLGDDGATLRAVREGGAAGVVVAAFGVGHVSKALAAEIAHTVDQQIPVVVSSRTSAGGTLERTYGFEGSEIDLLARGALLSGGLDARKSRLLLWALLASGTDLNRINVEFALLSSRHTT